jgi:hypothetical protein
MGRRVPVSKRPPSVFRKLVLVVVGADNDVPHLGYGPYMNRQAIGGTPGPPAIVLCSDFGLTLFGAVPGITQHPSKVDYLLLVDVLVPRDVEHLGLSSEDNDVLAVVALRDGSDRLQQREDRTPLDVVTCRMLKDRGQGVPMVIT